MKFFNADNAGHIRPFAYLSNVAVCTTRLACHYFIPNAVFILLDPS